MTVFGRMKSVVLVAAAISIPVLTNGCSDAAKAVGDAQGAVCCTEFKVGGTIDASIGGSAQSQVAVQAIADIAGIATAAIDDLTTACRGIAVDLDASAADQDKAEATADKNGKMKAWCALAVSAIGTAKGSGSITVAAQPPVCEASVDAKLDCQAKCSGGVKCDIKANPPKCTGGKLVVACKGECTAEAGASVSCEGSCTGSCSGSCTAEGGVECQGKCEGTCEASGAGGTGTGIQADGTCKGTCKGTCSVTAPSVTCNGSCNGSCSASCKGSATASVKCDGKCDVDAEPISCSGGKLEGGCTADAKCEANCSGSVQAKASCTPPSITVVVTGQADANIQANLIGTLKSHLSVVLALQARFKAVANLGLDISGNIGAVTDIKVGCIPPLVAAAAQAVSDLGDAGKACGDIAGTVTLGG